MTPEYRAWVAMKNRCLNPNQARFKDYGGRGIKICRRWLGEHGFENFLADMGPKPSPAHSMDRKKRTGITQNRIVVGRRKFNRRGMPDLIESSRSAESAWFWLRR